MKILLTSIPSDSHTWNLVFMQLFIEELGHTVFNLGCCVPIHELITNACEYGPHVIVVSSINGHGHIEGIEIAKAVRTHPLICHIPLIIGGKLGTEGNKNTSYVDKLITAGFNQVFIGENTVNDFAVFMQKLSAQFNSLIRVAKCHAKSCIN